MEAPDCGSPGMIPKDMLWDWLSRSLLPWLRMLLNPKGRPLSPHNHLLPRSRVYFFHWWPLKEMGSAATLEDIAVPGLVLLGLWASGVHHQHHHHTQGVDALICLFTFDRIGSSSLRAGFL